MRYAERMHGLPRRWVAAVVCGASVWGCGEASEAVVPPGGAAVEIPASGDEVSAGRLPEPTPELSGGDAGGDETLGEASESGSGETQASGGDDQEPAEPVMPEDYGQIKPPLPLPEAEALTVHAMAGYEVVTVYSQPDLTKGKLGYLRIGTRTMVTERVDGEGCAKGFYGLPSGGFACASKGLVVDSERPPFSKYPPPVPRMDQAMPYDYGFVRRWNGPMWWRIPTDLELQAMAVQRSARERQRLALAAEKVAEKPAETAEPVDTSEPAPVADLSVSQEELLAMKLPLSPDTPWLERGFFLSLGDKVVERGRTFYRTARGAYVAAADVSRYQAKDFEGQALGEMTYPFGFTSKETKLIELTAENKLKAVKTLERRVFLDLDEETEISGKAYMITSDRLLVRKEHLLLPELQPLPKGLEPWERWIDISLSQQLLVAYEGTTPVYTTLVSTGRKGPKDDPYDTPTGRWRIYSKHISTTMDGNSASDGNYSIQDVPWTMFFHGSYALHGAFWHRNFGSVRSHGCINMGPTDARWLFHWATPFLPEGWHGVNASDDSPGSTVIVRP